MRFLGNIEAKTDVKGRVFLPAVFRKELRGGETVSLVMRKDVFQPCLVLYPEDVWTAQTTLLRKRLSRWDSRQQSVFRQFVADAELVTLDANGRFLIPRRYLAMAGIERDVRFIGMDDSIEIWSAGRAASPFIDPSEFGTAIEEAMRDGDGAETDI